MLVTCPYPLPTYISPANPSGSMAPILDEAIDAEYGEFGSVYLCEPVTYKYSTENPVSPTDLAFKISPVTNPLTFAKLIVTSVAEEPELPAIISLPLLNGCSVVEFATINCPPTTFTLSFSNTAVESVPLILAFSNSAVPLPNVSILQPFKLVAKSALSIVPSACNINPFSPSANTPPNPAFGIVLI